MLRHEHGGFFHNLLECRGIVGLGEVEEHAADLGQKLAGLVVHGDHVVEGRSLFVGDDRVDFRFMLLDSLLEGGQKVRVLDLLERRDAERRVPFREERIFMLGASRHHKKYRCK